MIRYSGRCIWLSAGILFAIGSVSANDAATPLTEEDYFSPVPRVTSAARLEKSLLESGMSVTIIDRETIEASPAIEIPDLLRLVPGFQVAHATGSIFAAGYHGASDQWPRRMEVMVDGRSVYMNSLAAVEWSALGLAIEDIERIEVVRGPNAPTFGSNAMLGSINIVTRAPFLMRGKYLRTTIGSQDTGNAVARWGGKIADWDVSLTGQYRSDDGFDDVDDHKRFQDLRFRGDYQATTTDAISVHLGLTDGELGADGKLDPNKNTPFRDRDLRSHYQQLTWTHNEADGGRYRLNLYHNYYDTDDTYYIDNVLNPGSSWVLGFYTATSERYDLEFQHDLAPRENWRFAWGFGARYDELSSDLLLYEDESVDRKSGRLFGSMEWKPVKDVSMNLDLLTEVHESYGSETSPRLAINWLASPSRSFRASVSRSYRVYNLLARFIDSHWVDTDGNDYGQAVVSTLRDDFTPEKVTGYELGYMERWNELGLMLDLRLFREELEDSGTDQREGGVAYWLDEGNGWDTEGLDVQLDYRPNDNTRLVGAYSYAEIDGDTDNNEKPLDDSVPRHTLSMQLSHRFNPNWQGSLALYHMDEVRWLGVGSEVDDYTRLDLKLTRNLRLGEGDGQLALIVHNLADDEYNEFRVPGRHDRYGNVFDRRVYLQLSLGFD